MSKKSMKKKNKPKSKARKITSWIITGFFGILMAFALTIQIMGLVNKGDNFGVPNYFGKQVLVVLTDSMEPEYPVSSAVIVEKIPLEEYKVGDDITFKDPGSGLLITHRISEIRTPEESDKNLYEFETHGINTHSTQCQGKPGEFQDCTGQKQYFTQNEVLGKVVGCSAFLGWFLTFLTSPWGLLIILLVPTLYLIISSVIDIVKAVNDPVDHDKEGHDKKDDDPPSGGNDALANLSDKDKERLKQELLQQMLEKGKVNS